MRTVVASAPPAPAAVWRPPPLFRRRSAASARSPQRQLASCWAIARTARLVALAVCLLLVLLSPTGAAQPAAAGNSSSSAAVNSSSGGTSAGGAPGGGLGKLLTSAFQEQHPRPPPDGKPYNACVATHALPYAYCNIPASDGPVALTDPNLATGVEAEALKRVFDGGYLGDRWTYGTDWQFLCMSWDDIMADLTSPQPVCLVAAAGMSATEDALSAGVMFSDFPSTCSGIAVLTRARLQQSSIWFFLQPLAWGVWVLWLGLTAALIILMWLADVSSADDRSQYAQGWRGFGDAAFVTSTMSFTRAGANRFDHGTLAARLLGLFAAFFFMIFFTIYTAQLAGRLAASSLQSSVTGFASLRTGDFAVVYPRNLAWAAASAHIAGVPIDNWEDPAVRDAAFWLMDNAAHPSGQPPPTVQAALDSGAFSRQVPDALLSLLSQARLAAAQYCNLFIVGEQIQTTKQALAFPAAAPNITRRAFSIAENRLQEAESFFDASRTEAFLLVRLPAYAVNGACMQLQLQPTRLDALHGRLAAAALLRPHHRWLGCPGVLPNLLLAPLPSNRLLTVNATDFHPARCPGKLPVSSGLFGQGSSSGSQDQIQVNQILGLLVVLGVGMAASGLLMLWSCRSRRKRQWLRRHARAMLLPLWTCCGRQAGGKTAPAPEAPAPAVSDT